MLSCTTTTNNLTQQLFITFATRLSTVLSHLFQVSFTYYPSSAAVARTYAENLNKPLASRLTPLRLAYHAYLLALIIRLCLNSLFRETYHQYDLTVFLFERAITHHIAGLALLPLLLQAIVFDVTFVLRPHTKMAPMLVDLLQSEGMR